MDYEMKLSENAEIRLEDLVSDLLHAKAAWVNNLNIIDAFRAGFLEGYKYAHNEKKSELKKIIYGLIQEELMLNE